MAMFDTLRASRRLQEVGFEEAQADALVGIFADDVSENVATKSDIELLKADLRAVELRMTIRLAGLIAVATGIIVAAIGLD